MKQENFLRCGSDDKSYCFAAEITFTFPYSNDYTIDVKIAVSLFWLRGHIEYRRWKSDKWFIIVSSVNLAKNKNLLNAAIW